MRFNQKHSTKYLLPSLNLFGNTFLKELNLLTNYTVGHTVLSSVVDVGIGDVYYLRYKERSFELKPRLFMVFDILGCYNNRKDFYVDVNKGKERFKNFLTYIRSTKCYSDDYWIGKNRHCIVFSLDKFENSFEMFLKSRYSKMYNQEQLKNIGVVPFVTVKGKKLNNYTHAVLNKNEKIGKIYLKKVLEEYYAVSDIPENPLEYDIPWLSQDEIFYFDIIKEEEKAQLNAVKN